MARITVLVEVDGVLERKWEGELSESEYDAVVLPAWNTLQHQLGLLEAEALEE